MRDLSDYPAMSHADFTASQLGVVWLRVLKNVEGGSYVDVAWKGGDILRVDTLWLGADEGTQRDGDIVTIGRYKALIIGYDVYCRYSILQRIP